MTEAHDEQLLTRYVLDELSDEERSSVADRLADDEALFESLCALEDELLLRFHRGDLTAAERDRVERAYSISPARRRQLEAAGAFLEEVRSLPPDVLGPTGIWERARTWLRGSQHVPNLALVAAALVLVTTATLAFHGDAAWLGWIDRSDTASSDAGSRVIVAVQLSGHTLRRSSDSPQGTPVVRVPRDAREIRLEAVLPDAVASADALEVHLLDVDGDVVATDGRWSLTRTSVGTVLTLSVPAGELADGYYALTVRRPAAGGPDLAAHAFRVSRE